MTDRFNLERFVAAQAGSFEAALVEIRRGAKRSHWMWFNPAITLMSWQ